MTALNLTTTATADEILGMSQVLAHRALGKARILLLYVLILIGGAAFGQAIAWLAGIAPIDAFLVSIYAVMGAILTFFVASHQNRKAYSRMLHTSAFRQSACPITFSNEGLLYERRPLPWSAVTKVGRWKSCTLLHFSPADALVIPDRDLPASETPESFAARVEEWRKSVVAKA